MGMDIQRLIIFLTVLISAIVSGTLAFAQSCKVNDPDISTSYSGDCRNGLAHGNGTAKGRDTYSGPFLNGSKHGRGTYVWANGERYEGEWRNEKRTGRGTYFWPNGSRYEGEWLDGNRNGRGTMRLVAGDGGLSSYGSRGNWIDGLYVADGFWKENALVETVDERRIADQQRQAREAEERNFNALLTDGDPQKMYLAAGTLNRNGDSYKAKRVYEAIINRFPDSPFAVKASDQLSASHNADAIRSSAAKADSDARYRAYQQCKEEMDACYLRTKGKGQCYRDCNSLQ